MTPNERQQSLINARRACEWLREYALTLSGTSVWDNVNHLIAGFKLLDDKEQEQRDAGQLGAEFGKLGGRPRKKA